MLKKTRFFTLYLIAFLSGAALMSLVTPAQKASLKIEALPELHSSGFSIRYDGAKRIPLYTYEVITQDQLQKNAYRNQLRFKKDVRVYPLHQSSNQDYTHSGYDRGHMAAAGNHTTNPQDLEETFVLSNACPQHPSLNRGVWADLEKNIRLKARQGQAVEVVSGPLFLPQDESPRSVTYSVIGANSVAVPTHFFKLVYQDQKPTAYIFPNQEIKEQQSFKSYQVSIKKLEKLSGLQFKFN